MTSPAVTSAELRREGPHQALAAAFVSRIQVLIECGGCHQLIPEPGAGPQYDLCDRCHQKSPKTLDPMVAGW